MLNTTCCDSTCSWRSVVFKQPPPFLHPRHWGSTRSIPSRIPRLFLGKSLRFPLHPAIPSPHHHETIHSRTTSPLPIPRVSTSLNSLSSSSPSSVVSYIPSFTHYTHKNISFPHIQSYRQRKHNKRFRIGVTAPLPPYFVQACKKLKIPLTDEFIDGGVRIDDVQQDISFLREGEGTDNDMRWLL